MSARGGRKSSISPYSLPTSPPAALLHHVRTPCASLAYAGCICRNSSWFHATISELSPVNPLRLLPSPFLLHSFFPFEDCHILIWCPLSISNRATHPLDIEAGLFFSGFSRINHSPILLWLPSFLTKFSYRTLQ